MKNCFYCGRPSPDDTAYCPGCGTEFTQPPAPPKENTSGGQFRRPPRPEAASIVLQTFPHEAAAERALAILRAARIEAFIAADDCGGFFPPLSAVNPFRLVVSEVHQEAARQALAEADGSPVPPLEPAPSLEPSPSSISPPPSSTATGATSGLQSLWTFALGIFTGVLLVLGYQRTRERFTGTVGRDFNEDGRADAWDSYRNGQLSQSSLDRNGDEQPDFWYFYENDRPIRWEQDGNFDGKLDGWGRYDARSVDADSKADVDFDGKSDVTYLSEAGVIKEGHWILPSGLIWRKDYFTNGSVRQQWIDRNRDGQFDEKRFVDVYGIELSRENLN